MRQSCGVYEPISKKTVLAMLGAPSTEGFRVGETVAYTNEHGQTYQLRVINVARDTLTLATKSGAIVVPKTQCKSNLPPVIYDGLPDEAWSIRSFDPVTRVVCIDIITPNGVKHTAVTLPIITVS